MSGRLAIGGGAGDRWAAIALRRAYRLLARAPAAPLFPSALAQPVRARLFEMRADDVVKVLDWLESAGVRVWLAGGWGVDALLSRQTRRHRDLDLVVNAKDDSEQRARAALGRLGFATVRARAPAGNWMPLKAVLRDRSGRTIDLLPVPFLRDETTLAVSLRAGALDLPDALALGEVAGRAAPCLAPMVQLTFHTGYQPTRGQRRDVWLLCSEFRLPLPPSYG